MTPQPPPGFELIPHRRQEPQQSGPPPPPPGFELIPQDQVNTNPARSQAEAQVAKDREGGGMLQTVGEGLRSVARGVGMGYTDEIEAGLQGGLNTISGGYLGKPYDQALEYERAYDRATDKDQGLVGTGLQVAGALATAPFMPVAGGAAAGSRIAGGVATGAAYGGAAGFGAGEGGFVERAESAGQGAAVGALLGGGLTAGIEGGRAVRRAYANQGRSGAYGSIADDLPGGVDELADQVATGPSRGNVTTNRRTLDILGEEMQRSGGDVQAARQATLARIAAETGVQPATAATQVRRLTQVHEDSPLMLGEYPAVAGSDAAQRLRQPGNIELDDLGRTQDSTTQASLDYLANNGNAQSAQSTRNAISGRQETLAPALRDTLASYGPTVQTGPRTTRPAEIADTEALLNNAWQLASREYSAAYSSPVATPQSYQNLPRVLERYANMAVTRSPDVGNVIRQAINQFIYRRPDGSIGIQSLRQLQDARTSLRGQMTALDRIGRADMARVLRPLYQYVTRTMEEMSPQWAQANRRWADMNVDQLAQELGDAFATKAGPQYRQQIAQFQQLAPQAQEIVQVHFLQKMFDKIDNLGDQHGVSKLFSNDHSRSMIRELFGDEAVVSFTRAIRDQKVAERSQAMTGNSATHRRGVAQKQKDADTGLTAAVEGANARGVRNWLLEKATQLLTERKNRPMAEVLTTPISDTANVAQHIHNMRAQQERLRQLSGSSRLTRPAVNTAARLSGQNMTPRNEEAR